MVVLYQGRMCEVGPSTAVYNLPSNPYAEVLLGAVLEPSPDSILKLVADDVVELSPLARGESGHFIRCHIPFNELISGQKSS